MADKVEEPMENSADEEEEMERPPTPDYHHEGNEEVSSEISDDEDKEKDDSKQEQTRNVTESPVSEADKDEGDEKELEIVSSPSDSENLDENDVKNVENKIDSVDNTDSISNYNDNDPLDKENIQTDNDNEEEEVDNEEEEIEDKEDNEEEIEEDNEKENDEKEKPRKGSEEQENEEQDIDNEEEESVDSPVKSDNESEVDKKNTDKIKNSSNDDEESVEKEENAEEEREASEESMPLSPIGLGLSEPETALVDKILKEDAEENMPEDNSMDSKEGTSEKIENDEDDSQENEEEKVEKSVASDNEEDDEEKPDRSEDADDQDEEGSEPDEAGGDQLIQDIFGASDEEEEFEGFDQEEIDVSRSKEATSKSMISDDEDEGVTGEVTESMVVPKPKDDKEEDSESDEEEGTSGTVWDFDLMMEEKKANRAKKRRRKGEGEFISDSDDLVVEMIKQMKQAAEDDRMLNEAKQAATKKLKLLPLILKHLNKADLQYTFIDSGILNGLKDWLSPLPDGSLPHLQIRTGLLKILSSFPKLDTGALKVSGLGKAVMYVYRHPKEIRYNKDMAGKLINEWARPIFGVTSNFKSMSREEREERDYQNMSKRRRLSSAEEGGKTPRSIDRALQGEKKAARPGEKGFIMRARVPLPSNKDYVVRPKSNLDPMDFHRVNKSVSLADKQLRKLKDRKKSKAPTHAATVSVEGRKMAL